MNTLLMLVSEQTIPNYLFVKTFGPADHYVFITTAKMENPSVGKRREWILRAAGIGEERVTTIEVHPEKDLLLQVKFTSKQKIGFKTKKEMYNNEFDVLFVFRNTLYVVECKTTSAVKNDNFNNWVYKVAALRRYFMLSVQPVICTMSLLTPVNKERARLMGIHVIDRNDYLSGNSLKRWKEIVKIHASC